MLKNSSFRFLSTLALVAATFAGGAHASTVTAAPFGIAIGGSCKQALSTLGPSTTEEIDGGAVHHLKNPGALYVGANKMLVRCAGDEVIAVQFKAPKGFGNPEARSAYQTLAKNYKKVKGGAIPQVGTGYARFVKGPSVIEISAPHMEFEFTVTYYSKTFYDTIIANIKKREATTSTTNAQL